MHHLAAGNGAQRLPDFTLKGVPAVAVGSVSMTLRSPAK
jgi:hypothetical protein